MANEIEQDELLGHQYHDGKRLAARGYLHARFRTNSYGWFRWLFDHLRLAPQSRVLELGCGLGWLWRQNLDRIPAGWDVTLSDLSPGMLDEARRQLGESASSFHFAVVNAQAIPYPDGAFGAVIANHMLYHVPDRPQALAEIRRVLTPAGRLYASTIGNDYLRELWTLAAGHEREFGRAFPFNLENGAAQLREHFAHVALDRYDDTLVVTEAEPLLAYVFSLAPRGAARDDAAGIAVAQRIRAYFAAHDSLRITTDAGLFEAW